jgi:hypothetical protein
MTVTPDMESTIAELRREAKHEVTSHATSAKSVLMVIDELQKRAEIAERFLQVICNDVKGYIPLPPGYKPFDDELDGINSFREYMNFTYALIEDDVEMEGSE